MNQKFKLKIIIFLLIIFFDSCNKNTYQLPVIVAPSATLSISGIVNGLNIVDFIFEQTRSANSDTVWLSVKNNTAVDITSMRYVIELCRALPQNYDNCDLQLTAAIPQTLKADSAINRIFLWINKNITLDSTLINGTIISYNGINSDSLGNAYSSVYSVFETDTSTSAPLYYGNVRGYISADGKAMFRLKSPNEASYNVSGQFTGLKIFDGLLYKENTIISPFNLGALAGGSNTIIADTSSGKLHFRIDLQHPLDDTIHFISVLTKKYY